jgi:hypothetical protein
MVIYTKKNTEALFEASREVGLQVNKDKALYMLMYCHQNADNLLFGSRANKNVAKYLGTIVTNKKLMTIKTVIIPPVLFECANYSHTKGRTYIEGV